MGGGFWLASHYRPSSAHPLPRFTPRENQLLVQFVRAREMARHGYQGLGVHLVFAPNCIPQLFLFLASNLSST